METSANPADPSLLVLLEGFGFVIITLVLLWILTVTMSFLVGRAMGRLQAKVKHPSAGATPRAEPSPAVAADKAPAAAALVPPPSPAGGPAPEVIAALSAAVTMMLGDRHRIVSVRPVSRSYGYEGRRSHFGSHKIR